MAPTNMLESFEMDISHQEMDRIVTELDETLKTHPDPTQWIPLTAVSALLIEELGYEDEDEFEDALKGSFVSFCTALPHVEVQEGETGTQIRPKVETREPRKAVHKLVISDRSVLKRVCLKAAGATVEIPEIEFEIGGDSKRRIDTIYNHIAFAILNLGRYVAQAGTAQLSEDHRNKIVDTITVLNVMLDVEKPFTWIIHDPEGFSEIKPDEGVIHELL